MGPSSLPDPYVALLNDQVSNYLAHQTVLLANGTECSASQVSTSKLGGEFLGASAYDYDQEVVYICGGVFNGVVTGITDHYFISK